MNTCTIALMALSIIFCDSLYAQEPPDDLLMTQCINEVDRINNLVLSKGYLIYRDDVHHIEPAISTEYEDYGWTPACVYYDSVGRIRKYVDVNEMADGGGGHVNIMYFDEAGLLCYNLYSDVDQGQMLHGKMHVRNLTILQFEGSAYSMDYNNAEWRDFLYLDKSLPLKINEYEFAIGNVDDLKKWLKIENVSIPHGCSKVKFTAPRSGDTAVVSGDGVLVREEPSTTSKIVAKNSIGGFVSVLCVMHAETLGKFGTYNWYKVQQDWYEGKQTGYIFGAFLEPVEQVITE